MSINTYTLGSSLRVSGVFKNSSDVAIDPSVVKFKFREPNGNAVTYTYGTDAEIVKDSTGNYHVDLNLDTPGTWYYRYYSTGTGQAASEGQFTVDISEV